MHSYYISFPLELSFYILFTVFCISYLFTITISDHFFHECSIIKGYGVVQAKTGTLSLRTIVPVTIQIPHNWHLLVEYPLPLPFVADVMMLKRCDSFFQSVSLKGKRLALLTCFDIDIFSIHL